MWALLLLLAGSPAAPKTVPPSAATVSFTEYEAAMARGDRLAAADALWVVLEDPKASAQHGEAWVKLGSTLSELDFPYAALLAWSKAAEQDASKIGADLPKAADAAARVGDERLLAAALKVVPADADASARSAVALAVARSQFQEGNLAETLTALKLVDRESPQFGRAELLRGVVLAQQGKPVDAIAPMVIAQALIEKSEDPVRFRDSIQINLGRIYFAAENFPRAMEAYAGVSRGSPYWPEAQFERAWAHYRLNDMAGALALLYNHETPFLQDLYHPESELLRTYALFTLCKFPAARESIEAFAADYGPLREEINATVPALPPEAIFSDVAAASKGQPTALPYRFLRSFAGEDRLLDAIRASEAADAEAERLSRVNNRFATKAVEMLRARKADRAKTEGTRIQAALERRRKDLGGFLDNVEITRLDMMQLEATLYERAAVTGDTGLGDKVGRLRKTKAQRNVRNWPFEGEIWADELGYYRYELRSDCPMELSTQ